MSQWLVAMMVWEHPGFEQLANDNNARVRRSAERVGQISSGQPAFPAG